MARKPAPLDPLVLYERRIAGRALSMALDGYGLLDVARKFNADDPAECRPSITKGEFIFGDVEAPVATVYLEGASARVVIEAIDKLVRSSHLRDFEPEAVGIVHLPGRPDVDVTVDLTEVIQADGDLMRTAPQRLTPPSARRWASPPRVIRAFRGYR